MEHLCFKGGSCCCSHVCIRCNGNVSFERNFLPEDMSCGGGAGGILPPCCWYLLLVFMFDDLSEVSEKRRYS